MLYTDHKPAADNINADALSRLVRLREPQRDDTNDGVYGFLTTVVSVSMSTLRLLEQGYVDDPHLRFIYDTICGKMKARDDKLAVATNDDAVVSFKEFSRIDQLAPDEIEYNGFQGRLLRGHLLLYIKDPITSHPRLCILSNCHKTFFEAAHDKNVHAGYHKAYNLLRQHYYIRNMSRALRSYIQTCPSCQQNNTLRHMPHGQLQPVTSPDYPFQMVTLDLIVKLPESKFGNIYYDTIMTITDKLTKMVTLILGRENWSAVQWADAFFKNYYHRWGIPQQIITDRGKIFLGEFWTSLFKILRTDLLVTTAYHPQSDSQSERTNQIVEIALRHLVNNTKSDWSTFLGDIEFTINNSTHSATGVSPMKSLTGIDAPSPLTIASSNAPAPTTDWIQTRNEIQQSARDTLVFAQAKMSVYYDKKHKPILLKPGDKAYISLAGSMETGYHLPNTISHKLSLQRVGPFEVIRAVGRLAYEMKLPTTWKIHPVMSVAHLEPYKEDPYHCTPPDPSPDVVLDEAGEHEEWEAEEIVAQRRNRRRKRDEWLVKWRGFGPEHNTWEPMENLQNASELLDQFNEFKDPVAVASTFFLPSPHPPPPANAFLATIFSC
jgi:hypothetical protein